MCSIFFFFFSSRRRHTRFDCDWSSDVCSSDLRIARTFKQDLQFVGSHLLLSLLSFNLGVELGQLLVLLIVLPLLALFFRLPFAPRYGVLILSLLIADTGWRWLLDRAAGLRQVDWPIPRVPTAISLHEAPPSVDRTSVNASGPAGATPGPSEISPSASQAAIAASTRRSQCVWVTVQAYSSVPERDMPVSARPELKRARSRSGSRYARIASAEGARGEGRIGPVA